MIEGRYNEANHFILKGLEKVITEALSHSRERRKHSRATVSLPLHIQVDENEGVYPGLVIDASESGLLIQTLKEMFVGTIIDIEVLFPEKLCLPNFKAEAEIVWKDIYEQEGWEGYMYGLTFIQVSKEDYLKLKHILSVPCVKKTDFIERRYHPLTLDTRTG